MRDFSIQEAGDHTTFEFALTDWESKRRTMLGLYRFLQGLFSGASSVLIYGERCTITFRTTHLYTSGLDPKSFMEACLIELERKHPEPQ